MRIRNTPIFTNFIGSLISRSLFRLAQCAYLTHYSRKIARSWFRKSSSMEAGAFWDLRAHTYDQQYIKNTLLQLDRLESAMRSCEPLEEVIELGCGTGRNIEYLHARFPKTKFIGIDGSEQMILRSKARCANMDRVLLFHLNLSDIEKFYCPPKKQFVFSLSTLTYVDSVTTEKVCRYLSSLGCNFFYLEELFVRGFPHMKQLSWPGFPRGIIHNTNYLSILSGFTHIRKLSWRNGIFMNLLAECSEQK